MKEPYILLRKNQTIFAFFSKRILFRRKYFLLKTTYGKYLVDMSSVVVMVEKARNIYSIENYYKDFDQLDWRKKKVVNMEMPLLLLSEIVD
ncbi:MAG: hypothetical protein AB8F94_00130 [Saprospiraceae bacterium]